MKFLMKLIQAMLSNPGSFKPIYISVGHRISLATAVKIARMTSKYRIPEPIRQVGFCSCNPEKYPMVINVYFTVGRCIKAKVEARYELVV